MIPYNQLSLADIFQIARKFMKPASLSSSLFSKITLALMKLPLLPSGNISMHQRADPANTLCFDDNYDPYKAAYTSIPSHAASSPEIKQLYIDGHFCYSYKIGIVTNGLGIIRHFVFYNKDFFQKHPEIGIEKKYGSPDKDKSVHDTSLLIPTLQDYFHTKPECKDYTLNEDEIKTKAVFSLYKCVHFLNTFQLLATLTFLSVSPSQ